MGERGARHNWQGFSRTSSMRCGVTGDQDTGASGSKFGRLTRRIGKRLAALSVSHFADLESLGTYGSRPHSGERMRLSRRSLAIRPEPTQCPFLSEQLRLILRRKDLI